MVRPSGTVTFLFTDIEGSTRRWESDADTMQSALTAHDRVLRSAIDSHGGWLFKHTGDGVCAAFGSARSAVDAAVEAQRGLELPVRMGLATGEAHERDGDYFGPALNRAARVMAAGHGGQILLAGSTAALVDGADLIDLGEHRLRDLSGAHRLFQVRAPGLGEVFSPLRTLDAVPGNLPTFATSFLGRAVEVKELCELMRAHRLVTLSGVGGVGKTRLAVQVAAELTTEFPDGVWLVELAPVGDPASLPDVVATALGITPQSGSTVTDRVAQALNGRGLLVVLDNCEHLLDAAANLAEALLARTTSVKLLATSREGLRTAGEHLWAVPALDVRVGTGSVAVELFVERARSVVAGFNIDESDEADAVTEICRRLDGIPLAIELAAARMVAMSPQDVQDRLGDRFRLLSGAHRGPERHQTLRHAVAWSYELLDSNERAVLGRCSVFADGFDLRAAAHLCADMGFDDFTVLDLVDSLVRKSLLTADRVRGHARYGMLETIRQFAEEQLSAAGTLDAARDRHARYYADQALAHWDIYDGPGQRVAADWVDAEFANLRAGFRWSVERGDPVIAGVIAAHTAMLAWVLQRFEPVSWVEDILPAARSADLPQLPRLYTAAGLCSLTGRPEVGVGYAHEAMTLEQDTRYDPFPPGWSGFRAAVGHAYAGRVDRCLEINFGLVEQPGFAHVIGLCGAVFTLPAMGRVADAMALADEAVAAARARGNPSLIALALGSYGRAYAQADPARALDAVREGLVCAQANRLPYWEANIAREAAGLETVHGDLQRALDLFETAIDSFLRAGHVAHLAITLANLALYFDRVDKPDIAATLYGTSTQHASTGTVLDLPVALHHLSTTLGKSIFDEHVAAGAAMDSAEAVRYARQHIQTARRQLAGLPNPGAGLPNSPESGRVCRPARSNPGGTDDS